MKKKKVSRNAAEVGKKAKGATQAKQKQEQATAGTNAPVCRIEPPPLPPQRTPEEQAPFQALYNQTMRAAEATRVQYRCKEIAEHTLAKSKKILYAKDMTEAAQWAKKTEDSMFLYALAQWAMGRTPGPVKEENAFNLEQDAKKADNLAKMLTEKGDTEGAKDQKMRAIELRERSREALKPKTS